jgi:hypothetical protein
MIGCRIYRIKVYSDIEHNVGLRSLQSDIGGSGIRLSPILQIMDIGLSAHLSFEVSGFYPNKFFPSCLPMLIG